MLPPLPAPSPAPLRFPLVQAPRVHLRPEFWLLPCGRPRGRRRAGHRALALLPFPGAPERPPSSGRPGRLGSSPVRGQGEWRHRGPRAWAGVRVGPAQRRALSPLPAAPALSSALRLGAACSPREAGAAYGASLFSAHAPEASAEGRGCSAKPWSRGMSSPALGRAGVTCVGDKQAQPLRTPMGLGRGPRGWGGGRGAFKRRPGERPARRESI